MNTLTLKNAYIRVAAFGENLRKQNPYGWRCVIEDSMIVIPLTDVRVQGTITSKNQIWEFREKPDQHGIIAWVRYFGDICIDDNHTVHITLK